MRFAVAVPQYFPDGGFDAESFRSYLARAEVLGFDSAWTLEQTLGSRPLLSPIEAMTYAAACTSRLRLGCSVFATPMHVPVNLAKALATLDQMSHGRLEVGVGIGGPLRPLAAFGIGPERLAARYEEGLRLMKALWTGEPVRFDGDFWHLEGVGISPGTLQKPRPPLWFGASHPKALARAVREGDGFFGAGSVTASAFAEQVPLVRAGLERIGRDPASFQIAKRIYIVVDDDRRAALRQAKEGLEDLYPPVLGDLLPVAVHGTPEDCAEGVREVVDAGAELVLFTSFANDREQMERLATEVIPLVERG